MFSSTKVKSTVVLASALLLYTSPLSAALKTKPGATKVKAQSATPAVRLTSSTRNSSRKSSKTAAVSTRRASTSRSRERKARVSGVHFSKPSQPRSSQVKYRGQQSIDSARTLEIQQALIREHYLDGEATGTWDQATRDALTRYQGDNHWQTKILPDARALIRLGLGPSQQNLLNPETAAMAMPYQSGIEKSASGGSN